eukprot:Sro440_g143360.2  (137) ;mRNA; r:9735-10145
MTQKEMRSLHYYHDKTNASTIRHHEQVFHMSAVGSPRYMAPEVVKQPHLYNGKCDVYSWSILMVHLLALEDLFVDWNNLDILQRVVWGEERPALSYLRLPPPLEQLLKHAWATDLSVRPNVHQVLDHMELIVKYHL